MNESQARNAVTSTSTIIKPTRGKKMYEQLSKPLFLRNLKIAPFSSLMRSSGEKPVNFKIRKNVDLLDEV